MNVIWVAILWHEINKCLFFEKENKRLSGIENKFNELKKNKENNKKIIEKEKYIETYPIIPNISLIKSVKYIQSDTKFKMGNIEFWNIRNKLQKLVFNGTLHIWAKIAPENEYFSLINRQQLTNASFQANEWESIANLRLIDGNFMYDIWFSKEEIENNVDNFKENV